MPLLCSLVLVFKAHKVWPIDTFFAVFLQLNQQFLWAYGAHLHEIPCMYGYTTFFRLADWCCGVLTAFYELICLNLRFCHVNRLNGNDINRQL